MDVASALHCANLVLPAMVEAGDGAILFTGGGFALYPQAEYTCVSIDKAALRGLASAMNQELKEKGEIKQSYTERDLDKSCVHYERY